MHALCNVAVFDTEARIPAEKVAYALNQRLPEDIRIRKSEEVASDFHPRKQATRKTYEYKILNEEFLNPVERLYAHFTYVPLDETKMQEAANYLIGEHDFASFCAAGSTAETTVRTIYDIAVERNGSMISIKVTGNGFLYNMVRTMAGELLDLAEGKRTEESLILAFETGKRELLGKTMPAKGLTLMEVNYEKE